MTSQKELDWACFQKLDWVITDEHYENLQKMKKIRDEAAEEAKARSSFALPAPAQRRGTFEMTQEEVEQFRNLFPVTYTPTFGGMDEELERMDFEDFEDEYKNLFGHALSIGVPAAPTPCSCSPLFEAPMTAPSRMPLFGTPATATSHKSLFGAPPVFGPPASAAPAPAPVNLHPYCQPMHAISRCPQPIPRGDGSVFCACW